LELSSELAPPEADCHYSPMGSRIAFHFLPAEAGLEADISLEAVERQ
jgi:hypothetical protein